MNGGAGASTNGSPEPHLDCGPALQLEDWLAFWRVPGEGVGDHREADPPLDPIRTDIQLLTATVDRLDQSCRGTGRKVLEEWAKVFKHEPPTSLRGVLAGLG